MTPLSTSDTAVLLLAHAASSFVCDSFHYINTENWFTFVKINYTIIQINSTTNKLVWQYSLVSDSKKSFAYDSFMYFCDGLSNHLTLKWLIKIWSCVKCISVNCIPECFHFGLSVSAICKRDVCYLPCGWKLIQCLVSSVLPWILSYLTFSSSCFWLTLHRGCCD